MMTRPRRNAAATPAPEAMAQPAGVRKIKNVGDHAGCYNLCHPDGTMFGRNDTKEHADDGWVKAQVACGIFEYAD